MEPSVEEGFSFLDLEDCDVEDRNYLQTILEPRGPPISKNITEPPSNPPGTGGLAELADSRVHSKNSPVTRSHETAGAQTQQEREGKSSERGERFHNVSNIHDSQVVMSNSNMAAQGKTPNTTSYSSPANIVQTPRGPIRGQQHPGNFQAPQHAKVKPIQQTPVSAAVPTYLSDASQVIANPISGKSVAGGPVGNVPTSLHGPAAHTIQQQHHQQAYAAAAAAAANVQQQHAANHQTTPYVFINQVTANVNVHHGPVPNGSQQHSSGTKDAVNDGNFATGASQQLQMPPQGMGMPTNHQSVAGQQSIQGSHTAGIQPPIHIPGGQIGHATAMSSPPMSQPPPLHANVVTSLASGMNPQAPGNASMHHMLPNAYQLPPQMATGQIPYAIPSRPGTTPSQQPHAPPNPATIMPMQHLQQPYGYPIFFAPNVPLYAAPGSLHGQQQQMAQIQQAQLAMAQAQHSQMNLHQTTNHRQPPLQPNPVILRNPISPTALQQPGSNALLSPGGGPVNQTHQKITSASFTAHQRSPVQSIPTNSSVGGTQTASSQPSVPHNMVPSIIPSTQLPTQPQLNNQQSYYQSQQTVNPSNSLPTSTVITSFNPADAPFNQNMTHGQKIKNEIEDKSALGPTQTFQQPSNLPASSEVPTDDQRDLDVNSYPGSSEKHSSQFSRYQENQDKNQPADEEIWPQEDDEGGIAFGTVDPKSLVLCKGEDPIECDATEPRHSENIVADTITNQITAQPCHDNDNEISKYPTDKTDAISKGAFNEDEQANVTETEETNDKINDGITDASGGDKPPPDSPAKTKSWASLFKSSTHIPPTGSSYTPPNSSVFISEGKPTARIQPYKEIDNATSVNLDSSGQMAFNGKDVEMGNYLKDYTLNHRASSIKPRGLSNRSNWCFVNAILQALLACPPFYNLMKSLPKDLLMIPSSEQASRNPSVKILRAVYYFFTEFSPLDNFPKLNHRQNKNKKNEDLPLGKILEPTTIYNVLLNLNSDTFNVIEGRQEDAEEFLTFLLNGLNDEMMALLKLIDQQERDNDESDAAQGNDSIGKEEDDGNDDEWLEVGPRGTKSCVTRRVEKRGSGNCAKSPLAEMFQGQMRSYVQASNGEPTATLQPFLTLQLDIQSDKIGNVSDAISANFAEESIDGYMCSKTNQEIEASRSMSLEELPPILVLHLKRFIYDGSSNGCQKLLKNIDFPVDLEINKDILSPNSRNKYQTKQRQYKLFAVVYHNGSEATKGHYVTDIYHTGLSSWLRCDDSILKTQPESMVLAHSATSVPYILFYRRGDTMVGGSLNDKSGNKNTSSSNASKI